MIVPERDIMGQLCPLRWSLPRTRMRLRNVTLSVVMSDHFDAMTIRWRRRSSLFAVEWYLAVVEREDDNNIAG